MMRRRKLATALIAIVVLAALPANGQDGEGRSDQQCFAVSIYFAGHKKKDVRNFGQMAAVYFLGRLQVHAPELATSAALGAYIGSQTELELLKASDRCLEQFGQVGELFGSIGLEEEAEK